jgi:hypothetical protein
MNLIRVAASAAAIALLGATYPGTFALAGGHARVEALLSFTPVKSTEARFDLIETRPGDDRPIREYDTEMTKKLHLIVVRDDFTTFMHVHPMMGPDGHFRIDLRVPEIGAYHVYADTLPHGMGQQVFRFDVNVGEGPARRQVLTATPTSVTAGPYRVAFDALALDAGHKTMLTVHVSKGGKPAPDLRPYLGAMAHGVLIEASDLSYLHVHPMPLSAMSSMGEMKTGEMKENAPVNPGMRLHVTAPHAGAYKLWFEFRGGSQVYVAPFVLTAR